MGTRKKTYKVTAILTFPDGQLSGNLKIKATTPAMAEKMARIQLSSTWGSVKLQKIEIMGVK